MEDSRCEGSSEGGAGGQVQFHSHLMLMAQVLLLLNPILSIPAHSSILALEIPRMEEPGCLQSMGSNSQT